MLRAAIVGAGIGGLSVAICLAQRGWHVRVYEQAKALEPIGAGIQLSPNGNTVLSSMGVGHLYSTAVEPKSIIMQMGQTGRRICEIPLSCNWDDSFDQPYFHIHRADLVDALSQRLEDLAPGAIQFSSRLTEPPNGYDLVVGADGIHSIVRQHLFGEESPIFTGNVAWRCLVPTDAMPRYLRPEIAATIWAGPSRHAVTTYVRSGKWINFVGIVERDDWSSESWTAVGGKSLALQDFAGWHPTIQAILDVAPDQINQWALLRRDPLPAWSKGNTVVIGDAAHPMLPSLAQGGVQAIEDAWVLADMVTDTDDIPTALRTFYAKRIDRVSKVQAKSAANLRMFHKSGVISQLATYGPIWMVGKLAPSILENSQNWLFNFDATGQD